MPMNETRLSDWRIRLVITDGYERCRQRKLPSMQGHERKLYHPDHSVNDLRRDDMSYECSAGWQVRCCMSPEVETRRNWGPRHGSGGNGSIEFRNSGQEDSNQLGVPFICLFSSHLHTVLPHWITARYKWRRHGYFPPPARSQVEEEFPRTPDTPTCYRMVPIGSGTFELVRVRTRHDCLLLSFLSFSSLVYGLCSPGGLRLKRGIM